MHKAELKENILSGRQQLEAALVRMTDHQMTLTILHGEWTVKDLLGHLAFWEETVAELYATLRAGQEPAPFELDALNAKMLAQWGPVPLSEVKTREKAAFQRVLTLIETASEAELFDPAHFPWTGGRAFEGFFQDNTCGHYEEHLPEIIIWLKRIA
jgi:hypothetical protein